MSEYIVYDTTADRITHCQDAADAVETLLTNDGREYLVDRIDIDGQPQYELYLSERSRNRSGGPGKMRLCAAIMPQPSMDALRRAIINLSWWNQEAYTVEEWASMQAASA